ncbi:class E basic helix-loop-helix protein 41-like [Brienomyrus brachyistius]|uniref:class E basic helix-loop-helix protein 41-like n=1 Tax=Brienomyrus brachyistius TaxID=42636 RepID=UPI0020B44AB5|nr:class E basic helix-loop-helix protein 41-like [Brienomyrus brachyistius]
MDDRISRLPDRQSLDQADFLGVEYSSLYMCKSKRVVKREDAKDAYKLPHRLIEKKRRDRINECIGQLKDLLPEHLKLTTLGHLEKAVVLELTLKHVNALTAITEQQHKKIIALESGDRSTKSCVQADLDAFHSGFQTCAKEVLQFLNRSENWTARDQRCTQLINHLQKVCAQLLPSAQLLSQQLLASKSATVAHGQKAETQANCVPVIQRTHIGELNENDTDTDSGYGGDVEKYEWKADLDCNGAKAVGPQPVKIKQEYGDEPRAKRAKLDPNDFAMFKSDSPGRPDVSVLNSLMGLGGVPFGQQASFCMPFYFLNPSAAASYMPFVDKSNLEKYLLSATAAVTNPFPLLYPGLPAQAVAAAAAAFPGMSPALSVGKTFGLTSLSQNTDNQAPNLETPIEAEAASPVESQIMESPYGESKKTEADES